MANPQDLTDEEIDQLLKTGTILDGDPFGLPTDSYQVDPTQVVPTKLNPESPYKGIEPASPGYYIANPLSINPHGVQAAAVDWVANKAIQGSHLAHEYLGTPELSPKLPSQRIEEAQKNLPKFLQPSLNLGEILPASVQHQVELTPEQRTGWQGAVANLLPQQERFPTSTYSEEWLPYFGRLLNAVSSAPIAAQLHTYGQMYTQGKLLTPSDYLKNLSTTIGKGSGISEEFHRAGEVLEKLHPQLSNAANFFSLPTTLTGGASYFNNAILGGTSHEITLPTVMGAFGLGLDLLVPTPGEFFVKAPGKLEATEVRAQKSIEAQQEALRNALTETTKAPVPIADNVVQRGTSNPGAVYPELTWTSRRVQNVEDRLPETEMEQHFREHISRDAPEEATLSQPFDPRVQYLIRLDNPMVITDAPKASDFQHAPIVIQAIDLGGSKTKTHTNVVDILNPGNRVVGVEYRMDPETKLPKPISILTHFERPSSGAYTNLYEDAGRNLQGQSLTKPVPNPNNFGEVMFREENQFKRATLYGDAYEWLEKRINEISDKAAKENRAYTDAEREEISRLTTAKDAIVQQSIPGFTFANRETLEDLNKKVIPALPPGNLVQLRPEGPYPKLSDLFETRFEDDTSPFREMGAEKSTRVIDLETEGAMKGPLLQGRLLAESNLKSLPARKKMLDYVDELNQDLSGRGRLWEAATKSNKDLSEQASKSLVAELSNKLSTITEGIKKVVKDGRIELLEDDLIKRIKEHPEIQDTVLRGIDNFLDGLVDRFVDPELLSSEAKQDWLSKYKSTIKGINFYYRPDVFFQQIRDLTGEIMRGIARDFGNKFSEDTIRTEKLKAPIHFYIDGLKETYFKEFLEKMVDFGLSASGNSSKGFRTVMNETIPLEGVQDFIQEVSPLGRARNGNFERATEELHQLWVDSQISANDFADLVRQHLKADGGNFYQKVIEDVVQRSNQGITAINEKMSEMAELYGFDPKGFLLEPADYRSVYLDFLDNDVLTGAVQALEKGQSADQIATIMKGLHNNPEYTKKLAFALQSDISLQESSKMVKKLLNPNQGKTAIELLTNKDLDFDDKAWLLTALNSFFGGVSRVIRTGMTSGTLLPNLRNITTNFLSGGGLVYQQLGGKAAAGATAHLLDGMLIASHATPNERLGGIFKRFTGSLSDLARPVVFTRDPSALKAAGRSKPGFLTVEDLLRISQDYNLSAGQVAFEMGGKEIAQVMDHLNQKQKGLFTKTLDALGAGNNPNTWAQLNSDIDLSWRMGTLIGSLESGDTLAAAVRKAQYALFDFSKLSDVETKLLAKNVFFYSWMRHNVVSTLNNLISPKGLTRIKNQLRLVYSEPTDQQIRTGKGKTGIPIQKTQLTDNQMLFGPAIPTLDAIDFLTELGSVAYFMKTGRTGQAASTGLDILSQHFVNPYLDAFANAITAGKIDLRNRGLAGNPDSRIIGFYKAIPGVWDVVKNLFDLQVNTEKQYGMDKSGRVSPSPLSIQTNQYKFGSDQGRLLYSILSRNLFEMVFGRTAKDYEYFLDPRYSLTERGLIGTGLVSPRSTPSAFEQSLQEQNINQGFNQPR